MIAAGIARTIAVMRLFTMALALIVAQAGAGVPPAGVTVPMLDVGGRPLVDVRVNGAGPYPMILDTGASGTTLDATLAAELGVTAKAGANGDRGVHLESLAVGDVIVHGMETGIMAGMLGGLGGANPPRGVLSAAAFPGNLVVLDYPGRRVTIRPGALPAADGRRIFEYGAEQELPVVPVRVAGREITIHLDSGSPGGVMLPLKYEKELPLAAAPVRVGRARTVAGTFDVDAATLQGVVEIGEFTLDVKEIRFSDLRPGPEPGIGNVGAQVLKDFVVTFDAKNRRLKFERP
jgi:hypothetical protein